MSQDNPNSQPPSQPEPEPSQSPSRQRRRTPPPKQPSQRVQPFWKAQIIKLLRGTIGALEGAVQKLETESAPGTAETPSLWSGILAKIRSLLPENLSAKLSNTALTGVIAAIAVILIWVGSSVLTGKPTEVATVPPAEEKTVPSAEEKTVPSAEEKTVPSAEEKTVPSAEEKTVPPTEEKTVPSTEEVPDETITTPPELTAPEPPQPVEIVPSPEPEPTPTPILELTPEQTLIAAIENQVAEISDRFAEGLIKSIQANFGTSNLTVKISDDWYTLKESQQNKLAADMLQRSKELDFSNLEITDSQDRLVARNPVVGTEMVIFKRRA